MTDFYMRKVEVITEGKKFSGDDFTIYFSVPFDNGAEANIAQLELYNLKESTINSFKKGAEFVLNAGYKNDVGVILQGVAKIIETDRQNIDHITKISILDGNEKWFETPINKTYKKNTTGKQTLSDLIGLTGLKKGALTLPTNKTYQSGKALNVKLSEAINEIAKDCGAKVHVNKGKIFIRPTNEGDKTSILIDANYGLIGSPTPIEKEEKYSVVEKTPTTVKERGKTVTKYENKKVEKTKVRKGWKVKILLNHRITTDVILTIKSKTANGVFMVESGKHEGKGQSFYTEFECYPL